VIARPLEDQNDPKSSDEIYGFSESPLTEAVRQKSIAMVDLLLKYGAKDEQSTALSIAIENGDEQIICRLLAIKAHPDPDYKINKKAIPETDLRPTLSNLTYSSLFPNTPTMINWHSNNCHLTLIRMQWLIEAALNCNAKLKGHPKAHSISLVALTRIDISHNSLTSLPAEIFGLTSLRYLNLAQNKLEKIPPPSEKTDLSPKRGKRDKNWDYSVPVLEELYLQDNRLENIPANIFRLPNLQILDVSNNKLQELPFDLWKSPKLREFNVAFNLLKDLPYLPASEICGQQNEPLSPVADAYLFNAQYSYDENTGATRNTVTAKLEILHHNIWSKTLEVTDQEVRLPDAKNDTTVSQLSSLNLANNLFTSIPLALPCLAVNLTRLNMSYNSLRSMGHVTSYPASLKQLDLGHNEISCWPSLPRIAASDPHLACYNPQENKEKKNPSQNSQNSSTSSYTSDVQVVKSSQSSNNITSLRTAILKSVCCHRRHLRFVEF
jgi:Leucine-rich repeat (LRR) protein